MRRMIILRAQAARVAWVGLEPPAVGVPLAYIYRTEQSIIKTAYTDGDAVRIAQDGPLTRAVRR